MTANSALIFTTLKARPEFRTQVIKLIEKSFNYPSDFHFDIDFYPLLAPNNAQHNHLLIINGQLVAHLGCLPRTLSGGHPVILMGGIAVDANFRKKGYFSKIMKHVKNYYKETNSLYILWSDKKELYEKFNFHLAIGQVGSSSQAPDKKLLTQFQMRELKQLSKAELQEIKSLYNSLAMQYTCIERSDEDWKRILQISSTQIYLSRDEDNFIQAYFLIGKGFDLQGIIHEVAYLSSYKETILKKLINYNLWLPEMEASRFKMPMITYMASIAIADEKKFHDFIYDWSGKKISIKKITDKEITFIMREVEFVATHTEFFQYLWGPYPLKDFEETGPPIYIAGVDSI